MRKKLKITVMSIMLIVMMTSNPMTMQATTHEVVQVTAPTPIDPTPAERQIKWHDRKKAIFLHFGMNTFTNKEWGDGKEDPNTFNPGPEYNPEQWVRTMKEAGFELIILTAKHHDGFCLWPSDYTTHDVASSTWKNGKGDVVKDVSDACKKHGVDFGIYLSPWDRHEKTFGTGTAYDTFYTAQLNELLDNYGPISEVWWDGAGSQDQTYNYEGWTNIVREKCPDAVIFGCFGFGPYADIHWIGNEHGYAGEPNWSMLNPSVIEVEDTSILPYGQLNGAKWISGEADVSIRPGWFYHSIQDGRVKSLDKLVDIYLSSVGRNAVLLLNVPPDKRGLIHENDVNRLKEFKKWLDNTFSVDLAKNATATSTNSRGDLYSAQKVLDNDSSTYWATQDNVTTASIELDLGGIKEFDLISLQEPIQLGQRVTEYNIEVYNGAEWSTIQTKLSIGNNRILSFSPVAASKIKLNITQARACPAIEGIQVYKKAKTSGGNTPNPQGNLALNQLVTVTNIHSSPYVGSKAVDGKDTTRWATSDHIRDCWLEVDFMGQTQFNNVVIKQLGQRLKDFKIQYFNGFSWKDCYTGNTPESVQEITFDPVTSNKVRLKIESIHGNLGPSIYEFEVYNKDNQ